MFLLSENDLNLLIGGRFDDRMLLARVNVLIEQKKVLIENLESMRGTYSVPLVRQTLAGLQQMRANLHGRLEK